ncbi:MAG: sigma-54 dependent transcriptional regulator [Fibrobacterales bacterium]
MSGSRFDLDILLVDDESHFIESAKMYLKTEGYTNCISCSDSTRVKDILAQQDIAIVFLDVMMPGISGRELLEYIQSEYPHILVIMITAINEIEMAVSSIKGGAFDYLQKPITPDSLVTTLKKAVEHIVLLNQSQQLKNTIFDSTKNIDSAFEKMLSQDQHMFKIFSYIDAIAETNAPVLIRGETGTGKELLAQAIHKRSGRKGEFIAVNIAGVDDTLFSDTLFGHCKGAFTGADSERKGFIEQAQDGTIFLDEIGDLKHESQVKLLRLIQEQQYHPLGSDAPKKSSARIITATHVDLTLAKNEGFFRKDLYYRLQAHEVTLPPLRERKSDLPLLIHAFVENAVSVLHKQHIHIPEELYSLCNNYSFPGNVRELESLIFDSVSRSQGSVLSLKSIKDKMYDPKTQSEIELLIDHDNNKTEREILKSLVHLPNAERMEEALIDEALYRTKGNKSQAAQLIGLTRQTLTNKLKKRDGEK